MDNLKRRWKRLPASVRQPLILIIGCLLIVAALLTGPLPGPGGIPIFLLAIAVLATEFEWARKIRDEVLQWLEWLGTRWRRHKILGTLLLLLGIAAGTYVGWLTYHHFKA